METINVKEQARSLIDRLPEDITWQDLMYESIELPSVQGSRKRVNIMKFLAAILNSERIGKNREIITNYDDCDEPLDLLPSSLVNRLLEKAKELTKLSAEIAEIITALDSERATNRKLLAPTPKKQRRPPLFGSDRDVISVSENFDEPLEDFQDYM
jgi:hypothetical protein